MDDDQEKRGSGMITILYENRLKVYGCGVEPQIVQTRPDTAGPSSIGIAFRLVALLYSSTEV